MIGLQINENITYSGQKIFDDWDDCFKYLNNRGEIDWEKLSEYVENGKLEEDDLNDRRAVLEEGLSIGYVFEAQADKPILEFPYRCKFNGVTLSRYFESHDYDSNVAFSVSNFLETTLKDCDIETSIEIINNLLNSRIADIDSTFCEIIWKY